MLRKYRNWIFDELKTACEKHGVSFSDFDFTCDDNQQIYKLKYKNGSGEFDYHYNRALKHYILAENPSDDAGAQLHYIDEVVTTFEYIGSWVKSIKDEFLEPDLWEEYAKSNSANVLDTVNNEPLTQEEQAKAAKILENVKTYALENSSHEDTESLKAHIDNHFQFLHEARKRGGKKAWILMYTGTILGLIGSHIFSAENVSDFIQFAMEKLQLLSDLDVPTLVNEVLPPEIQGGSVGKPH